MKRLLSGIQATGRLHLGNYLGAIKNWLKLQDDYNSFFFIADLHSITVPVEPKDLHDAVFSNAAMYLACGLDPDKTAIFRQSQLSEHAELAWILSCYAQMGWMSRMTQFKEKSEKYKEGCSLGLFSYPALMAADILLYKPDIVPVGDDQKQHLELTRDIALGFNRIREVEFFKLPEAKIMGAATRVMSLKDGLKKMSKSDESEYSRINLDDSDDAILKKIKKAKSDSIVEIYANAEERPDVTNLLNIFSAISNKSVKEVISNYEGVGFAQFKKDLGESLVELISPIRGEYDKLMQDKAHISAMLQKGEEKARAVARKTLSEVKEIVGFTK